DPRMEVLPMGKGEVLCEGTDVAIVAIGAPVWQAVKAAERLRQDGVSTAGVNARFWKTLDRGVMTNLAQQVRYDLTGEAGGKMGGFGSAVLEVLSDAGITDVTAKILGLPDSYIEQGPQDLLRERYGLTAEGIYRSVKELIGRAPATRDRFSGATITDHLPHGDEQGS